MIVYDRLWKLMAEKGFTTYTLRFKNNISSSTVRRLQMNMSVSTHTLANLCRIFGCSLEEIAEYIPDEDIPDEGIQNKNSHP